MQIRRGAGSAELEVWTRSAGDYTDDVFNARCPADFAKGKERRAGCCQVFYRKEWLTPLTQGSEGRKAGC